MGRRRDGGWQKAGARRKLEEESTPVAPGAPLDELIGQNARDRLTAVKRGLRAILDLLSDRPIAQEFELEPPQRQAVKSRTAARGRTDGARAKRPASVPCGQPS